MVDHIVKSYLNHKINCRNEKSSENAQSEIRTRYFKLPFIGLHSKLMQNKIDQHYKSLKVKLVFTSEKLRFAFSSKDPYQNEHLPKVVYKFVCAIDTTSYKHQLRIQESLYITWLKPILNKQKQYQYILSLSL